MSNQAEETDLVKTHNLEVSESKGEYSIKMKGGGVGADRLCSLVGH